MGLIVGGACSAGRRGTRPVVVGGRRWRRCSSRCQPLPSCACKYPARSGSGSLDQRMFRMFPVMSASSPRGNCLSSSLSSGVMEPVDYFDTFIAAADDCRAVKGTPPPVKEDNPSVAVRTYWMISAHPYEFTSGDVIFTVYADRHGIAESERPEVRAEFYKKGQPCLRSSDLGRRYGWGIHVDSAGRVALYGMETPEYAEFVTGQQHSAAGTPVTVTKAMRSSRANR